MFDFPAPATAGQTFEPIPGLVYAFDGAGWSYTSAKVLTLLSIAPDVAQVGAPALTVTAYGANFTASTKVFWDGAVVGATTFVSPSQLTWQVDPTLEVAARSVPVTVQDGATIGVGVAYFNFTAVTPISVTRLDPAFGECSFDVPVKVIGGGFLPSTIVHVDGAPVTTTYASGTELSVTMLGTAIAAPVQQSVTALNGAQTSNAVMFNWVLTPTVTDIAPDIIGMEDAPHTVVVTGTNFTAASYATVGLVPLPTVFMSATQLNVTVDPVAIGTNGLVPVRVRTGTGQPAIVSNAHDFQIVANPKLTMLKPATAPVGGAAFPVELYCDASRTPGYATVLLDGTRVATTVNANNVHEFSMPPAAAASTVQVSITIGGTDNDVQPTQPPLTLPFTFV